LKNYFLVKSGLFVSVISILAGAIVRATGSGDGCGSTWPKCNGSFIPNLLETSEIIEFIHRSISGVLLVITLILFVKSTKLPKVNLTRKITLLLTFFVLLEAAIGAVIVLYEWVGMNSSLPRIIAVPIHLVNTFGLLGCYAALFTVYKFNIKNLDGFVDFDFKKVFTLFLLAGATGSIAALSDVLFPSETFIQGLVSDFDTTSELLTRLRILHPIISLILSLVLVTQSKKIQKNYGVDTKLLIYLVSASILLGLTNVITNIMLPLSILHLAMADILWITYIYVSIKKLEINNTIN